MTTTSVLRPYGGPPTRPVRGFVSPAEFVPLAEQNGPLVEVTETAVFSRPVAELDFPTFARLPT